MANKAMVGLTYPEVFAALGKFIADKKLQDVFITEFEEGIIVSGATMVPTAESYSHTLETYIFSADSLRALITGKKSARRGLFGR